MTPRARHRRGRLGLAEPNRVQLRPDRGRAELSRRVRGAFAAQSADRCRRTPRLPVAGADPDSSSEGDAVLPDSSSTSNATMLGFERAILARKSAFTSASSIAEAPSRVPSRKTPESPKESTNL